MQRRLKYFVLSSVIYGGPNRPRDELNGALLVYSTSGFPVQEFLQMSYPDIGSAKEDLVERAKACSRERASKSGGVVLPTKGGFAVYVEDDASAPHEDKVYDVYPWNFFSPDLVTRALQYGGAEVTLETVDRTHVLEDEAEGELCRIVASFPRAGVQ